MIKLYAATAIICASLAVQPSAAYAESYIQTPDGAIEVVQDLKNPALSGVASFFVPGLGHAMNGDGDTAAGYIAGRILTGVAGFVLVGWKDTTSVASSQPSVLPIVGFALLAVSGIMAIVDGTGAASGANAKNSAAMDRITELNKTAAKAATKH